MPPVKLILVGGFLGAGKTTLLTQAAARLVGQGLRVGLITNDQAAGLVDTGLLRRAPVGVQEVSGGCFCCKFSDLVAAGEALIREHRPDILLAEPVGSCTDLVATVVRPLVQLYSDQFMLGPFSVLVDPARLRDALADAVPSLLPERVGYIFGKQLEEADYIVINKADGLDDDALAELKALLARRYRGVQVLHISALTGEGVDAWLNLALQARPAAEKVVEVDYDQYAEGEALLGWLNATLELSAHGEADWAGLCRAVMEHVRAGCRARSGEIAHVKLFLTATGGSIQANLTSTDGDVYVSGSAPASCREATLLLNARVSLSPESLREVVENSLAKALEVKVRTKIVDLRCFSPARPVPTHRLSPVQ